MFDVEHCEETHLIEWNDAVMKETDNAMIKRADGLIERFRKAEGDDVLWFDDIDLFCNWLERLSETMKRPSFLYYRKCLAYKARHEGFDDQGDQIMRVGRKGRPVSTDHWDQLDKAKSRPKNDVRTAKGLYAEEVGRDAVSLVMRELIAQNELGEFKYTHGGECAALFQASMMTGLRPIEWGTAELHPTMYCPALGHRLDWVLSVNTAKVKHPRDDDALSEEKGLPPTQLQRYLVLDQFTEQERKVIDRVITWAHDEEAWPDHYERLRKTFIYCMDKVRKDIHEKTSASGPMTVYTARHLFASEIRRTQAYSPYELAALMGHVDTSNQRYYGDLSGEGGRVFNYSLPRPWPGSAAEIERREARGALETYTD